jgi:hypothetical protein
VPGERIYTRPPSARRRRAAPHAERRRGTSLPLSEWQAVGPSLAASDYQLAGQSGDVRGMWRWPRRGDLQKPAQASRASSHYVCNTMRPNAASIAAKGTELNARVSRLQQEPRAS